MVKAARGKAKANVGQGQVEKASEGDFVTLRPLPGLKNMGNTCWLNAVMQALTHCQPLVEAIERSGHRGTCDSPECVLCSMERHITTACCSTAPFMSPEKIVNLLPMISSSLMRGRQEDAHEFLRTLVSSMQLSLEQNNDMKEDSQSEDEDASQVSGFSHNRKRRGHSKKSEAMGRRSSRLNKEEKGKEVEENLTDSDNDNDERVSVSSAESQYPFSLFNGAIQNQVRCTRCRKLSTKEDPVEDLELEISRSSSLENALTQFCAEEELKDGNAYHCEKCKAKVTAKKSIKLHSVPPVLTVSLKRFAVTAPQYAASSSSSTGGASRAVQSPSAEAAPKGLWGLFSASKNGQGDVASQSRYDRNASMGVTRRGRGRGGPQKIQHYVHYPEYLDLTPFCTAQDRGSRNHDPEYFMRLFAVVVHLGSTIGAGHYVAYVRSLPQTRPSPRKGSSSYSMGGRAAAGWHRMDDCNVTLCSTEEALNQCAYILFYERCSEAEVRQWQRAQARGLSDINRIYSEKLLASQDKEEKKRERREPAGRHNGEGEGGGGDPGGRRAKKGGRTAKGGRTKAGSAVGVSVVRALRLDDEAEAPDVSDAGTEELGGGGGEDYDADPAGGVSQGGLLSWLFPASPSSSPSATATATRQTRGSRAAPAAAKTVSGGGADSTVRSASRDVKAKGKGRSRAVAATATAPLRRSDRSRGVNEGSTMGEQEEQEEEEEEEQMPMTHARKRQRVGPGEGIVKAVAKFVEGIFYDD